MRRALDISAYLVLGPENVGSGAVPRVAQVTQASQIARVSQTARQAIEAGFTCVQVRSKVASARELMQCVAGVAAEIAALGKSDSVALLVDDRLDVVLACREQGIKVDGVHVGQSDIPPEICRAYLGEDAVVGLSARADEMLDYLKTADVSCVDYFGVGPLHETPTKADCGLDKNGNIIVKTLDDIADLQKVTPLPIVVGGGVKAADLPALKSTGVAGFFVVSAVCGAPNPFAAAKELADIWQQ